MDDIGVVIRALDLLRPSLNIAHFLEAVESSAQN